MIHPIPVICLSAAILLTPIASLAGTAGPQEEHRSEEKQSEQRQKYSKRQLYSGKNSELLSTQQIAVIAEILSKYSPDKLTAADAKAINNAFRQAGIRRGPGQPQAIRAAGFDPEKIRALDPPPEHKAVRRDD